MITLETKAWQRRVRLMFGVLIAVLIAICAACTLWLFLGHELLPDSIDPPPDYTLPILSMTAS